MTWVFVWTWILLPAAVALALGSGGIAYALRLARQGDEMPSPRGR